MQFGILNLIQVWRKVVTIMQIAALQNLSSFTLLDSPTKVADLIKTAKEKAIVP